KPSPVHPASGAQSGSRPAPRPTLRNTSRFSGTSYLSRRSAPEVVPQADAIRPRRRDGGISQRWRKRMNACASVNGLLANVAHVGRDRPIAVRRVVGQVGIEGRVAARSFLIDIVEAKPPSGSELHGAVKHHGVTGRESERAGVSRRTSPLRCTRHLKAGT